MKFAALSFVALTALITLTSPVDARLHCRRHGPCHQVVAPKIDLKHGTGVHFMRCRHHNGRLGHC